MTREEQKEKLHFLQMSEQFFAELPVRRLLRASGGDTMFRIYMQAHCVALRTGGTLELHADLEPAEEIALLIGAPATEVPMIATTMQHCLRYGLITTDDGGAGKVISFALTAEYTRAWTKDALDRRQKRLAGESAPRIEGKAEEKAEEKTKPEDKIDYKAIRDAWNSMAEGAGIAPIVRMTDTRRKHIGARVKEYGIDQCLTAIGRVGESPFLRGENDRGWQATIDWLCGTSDAMARVLEGKYAPKGQGAQPTPQSQAVTAETINQTILTKGIYDMRAEAWNRERFEEVKSELAPEMAAAIAARMG